MLGAALYIDKYARCSFEFDYRMKQKRIVYPAEWLQCMKINRYNIYSAFNRAIRRHIFPRLLHRVIYLDLVCLSCLYAFTD